jgi:hypothetical protein
MIITENALFQVKNRKSSGAATRFPKRRPQDIIPGAKLNIRLKPPEKKRGAPRVAAE